MNKEINAIAKELKNFPGVIAIGVTGSFSTCETDKYSDTDLLVYFQSKIPNLKQREQIYNNLKIGKYIFKNVHFEIVTSDGLIYKNKEYNIIFQTVSKSNEYIENILSNYLSDEYFPGGIQKVIEIWDPEKIIAKLKSKTSKYPKKRAFKRAHALLNQLHHSITNLKWLEKAIYRNDYLQIIRYENEYITKIIEIVFALNFQWFCDDKRLLAKLSSLKIKPRNLDKRLNNLLRKGTLKLNFQNRKKEIYKIINEIAEIQNTQTRKA
jgi:predicted nucleotidyltransferase